MATPVILALLVFWILLAMRALAYGDVGLAAIYMVAGIGLTAVRFMSQKGSGDSRFRSSGRFSRSQGSMHSFSTMRPGAPATRAGGPPLSRPPTHSLADINQQLHERTKQKLLAEEPKEEPRQFGRGIPWHQLDPKLLPPGHKPRRKRD
jgi:hypothetical protein